MKIQINKFPINNELDIVLAHKRASQICELTGISVSDKTRFSTAISEICRNCLEFAKNGNVILLIDEQNGHYCLESVIEDHGPGIKNLDILLTKEHLNSVARGVGILHARKLVDFFNIQTSTSGTKVFLGMKVPANHPPINSIIIKGWIQHFEKNLPVSPYEEIKKQNILLLEVTEQLKLKNFQAENQIVEIQALNDQLKKANGELEDFTYTISHDLKAPINNMEMLVSHLNAAEIDAKNKKFVKALDTSLEKLKSTVQGLIEIIETQNTGSDIVKKISFQEIFDSIEEQYMSEIKESGAVLDHSFMYATINYYKPYIQSVLQNLINNAIKYRSPERELLIEVSTIKNAEFCILQVKDNGIGMDLSKVMKTLFKPFTRFNNSTEGKGIGLHLVKSMVERNGGKIEVESEVGKGTNFKIFLKEY